MLAAPTSKTGNLQQVAKVLSISDPRHRILGGLEGAGITENIREAYAFVANNFWPLTQGEVNDPSVPMDEIVILGFSRGAYTARAIADLISTIGLLTYVYFLASPASTGG